MFDNRDDHPKNFAYLMSPTGTWTLAPAYDVTSCEGPGGYHQMDVMGEAMAIGRKQLLQLGVQEAELSEAPVSDIIGKICDGASHFTSLTKHLFPHQVTAEPLHASRRQIDDNIRQLTSIPRIGVGLYLGARPPAIAGRHKAHG